MTQWQNFFKDKRVTLMGLGLLGRGVGDAEFLARRGARLVVTDLKKERELAPSLERLKKHKDIVFHLGGHRLEDFKDKDFILKAAGVPLESLYIAEACKNKIPVEMDSSLFLKLAPKITTIGVTGTRGKSTTTVLIYEILKRAGKKVFLGGNVKGVATLPLLEEITQPDGGGNYIALELDSFQLQGFGDARLSPHIAVFTTFFPDHMSYYGSTSLTTSKAMERYFEDKAQIFRHQKKEDVFIVGEQAASEFKKYGYNIPHGAVVARAADFPKGWNLKIIGEHNRLNAMCALSAARALQIPDDVSRAVFEEFSGMDGRLQFIKETKGIKIYNDNNSTTPEATIAALRALGDKKQKRLVLVIGGDDKKLDMSGLVKEIPRFCKAVVLFSERGTDKIRDQAFALKDEGVDVYEENGLENTVRRAFSCAKSGDILLYSPAFSSFGKWFKNEYDRGEQFVKIAEDL